MKQFFLFCFTLLVFSACQVRYELSLTNMGLYNTQKVNRTSSDETVTGYRSNASGAELFSLTHIIYLDDVLEKQFFGFNYVIQKFHNNKLKSLDVVKYDLIIKSPPIVKPNGDVITEQEQILVGLTDVETYNGYILSEEWEKVPGLWSFEFLVKGKLIGVIKFDIREGSAALNNISYGAFDVDPEFIGGNKALKAYLRKHLNYPKEALDQELQGEVVIGFIVNKIGELSDFSIVKSANYYLDQAALQLVTEMPNWKPAIIDGETVNAVYNFPVQFVLKK